MIPTTFKSKLPKALSWPVGAETISIGLQAAPLASEFGIRFRDSPTTRLSDFQAILREEQPYAVLIAAYKPKLRLPYNECESSAADGFYDARWSVTVYPVLREWRSSAGTLIREQGLPAIVEWLQSLPTKDGTWHDQQHTMELIYHPKDHSLAIRS